MYFDGIEDMARLKKEVKLYIVQSLAVFNTPTEVAKDIKEIYGIELKPQNIEGYDPTKRAGKDLSEEFKKEFEETRKDFLEKPLNIPASNDAVQLKVLDGLLWRNKGNAVMAVKIIDQIQKIMNDHYSKRIEITGANGCAIKTETEQKQSQPTLTPDQLAELTPQELSRLAINGKL